MVPWCIALMVTLSLAAVYRGVRGPRTEDRLVAVNLICTDTVLIVILLAYLRRSFMFLDVALVYALCSFLATVAVLKGLRRGRLS